VIVVSLEVGIIGRLTYKTFIKMASFTNLGPGCTNLDTNISIEYNRAVPIMTFAVIKKEAGGVNIKLKINLSDNTVEFYRGSDGNLKVNVLDANDFTGFERNPDGGWEIQGTDHSFDAKIVQDADGSNARFIGVTDGRNAITLQPAYTVPIDYDNNNNRTRRVRLWFSATTDQLMIGFKNTAISGARVNPSMVGTICWGSEFQACYGCPAPAPAS
jgi:hypothetical protein